MTKVFEQRPYCDIIIEFDKHKIFIKQTGDYIAIKPSELSRLICELQTIQNQCEMLREVVK
jgi:hypothetical protein